MVEEEICSWTEKEFIEIILKQIPELKTMNSNKVKDLFFKSLKIKVVSKDYILAEEDTIPSEVSIVLRGDVILYRRLPGDKFVPKGKRIELMPKQEGDTKANAGKASPSKLNTAKSRSGTPTENDGSSTNNIETTSNDKTERGTLDEKTTNRQSTTKSG